MTSLLHYTHSFKLVMDGSVFDAYAILENEDLAKTMRLLCKYSSAIHTVGITGSSIPIFWPDLSREFQEAFRDLIHLPTVTTLCLDNISGVPETILRGTNISHIRFYLVKLFNPTPGLRPFFSLSQTDKLGDIDIDYTFPFSPDDSSSGSPFQPSLSNLRSLKYTFYHPEDFQRFVNIALSLKSLEKINILFSDSTSMFFQGLGFDIPFNSLPLLRTLGICHKSPIATGIRSPLLKVLDLLRCINALPPSLETLVLGFVIRTNPPWLRLSEFFPEPKTWALLDKLLSTERFGRVNTVQMRLQYVTLPGKPWSFDEAIFVERCRSCLEHVFPLLIASERTRKKIELDVAVFPLGRNVDVLAIDI